MNITPIRTKAQYKAALKETASLMGAKADTADLDRKRPLTLRMIEGLHRRLGIPAESPLKQRRSNKVA